MAAKRLEAGLISAIAEFTPAPTGTKDSSVESGYLDGLPTSGDESGRAFRDLELEKQVEAIAQKSGIGAQFGGKYFCLDARVIRLPRHGASCPIGMGVSCSADRQILGKITADGIFVEQLETNPARFLPETKGAMP